MKDQADLSVRWSIMFKMLRFGLQVIRLRALRQCRPEQIRALQERRLRALLRYASRHSPFYRERLRGLDLAACPLADLPVLTKAEMMAQFDQVVTDRRIRRVEVERFIAGPANLGRPYLGRYAVCHTSGSQGQPALVVQEGDDNLLGLEAQFARGGDSSGFLGKAVRWLRDPIRFAVVTQKPGFYPSGAVFSYLAEARNPQINFLHMSVFEPVPDLVARLNEFQPEIIIGYPGALEALAREQQQGRLRLRESGRLRQLVSVSEPLLATGREVIESAFGAHVADHYAMSECSALTFGCPRYNGAHLNTDLAVLEVLDDHDRPVRAGAPGTKVLVTNLYNRAQPLIRYQIGDVVTMSPSPCPCGSPFPLIRSVSGRAEERFWIDVQGEYREIPAFLFLAALHHETNLAEHQVLQTSRNHFVLRVVPQPGQAVSADRLDHWVRRSVGAEGLADRVTWEIEVVPEIPSDSGSGKTRRTRSLIGPPPGVGAARPESRSGVGAPA